MKSSAYPDADADGPYTHTVYVAEGAPGANQDQQENTAFASGPGMGAPAYHGAYSYDYTYDSMAMDDGFGAAAAERGELNDYEYDLFERNRREQKEAEKNGGCCSCCCTPCCKTAMVVILSVFAFLGLVTFYCCYKSEKQKMYEAEQKARENPLTTLDALLPASECAGDSGLKSDAEKLNELLPTTTTGLQVSESTSLSSDHQLSLPALDAEKERAVNDFIKARATTREGVDRLMRVLKCADDLDRLANLRKMSEAEGFDWSQVDKKSKWMQEKGEGAGRLALAKAGVADHRLMGIGLKGLILLQTASKPTHEHDPFHATSKYYNQWSLEPYVTYGTDRDLMRTLKKEMTRGEYVDEVDRVLRTRSTTDEGGERDVTRREWHADEHFQFKSNFEFPALGEGESEANDQQMQAMMQDPQNPQMQVLAIMLQNPQMQVLLHDQQNPQMLQQVLGQLAQTNPETVQALQQNPQMLMQILATKSFQRELHGVALRNGNWEAAELPKSVGLLKESDMLFGQESEWHRSGAWFQLRANGIWRAREARLKLTAAAASQQGEKLRFPGYYDLHYRDCYFDMKHARHRWAGIGKSKFGNGSLRYLRPGKSESTFTGPGERPSPVESFPGGSGPPHVPENDPYSVRYGLRKTGMRDALRAQLDHDMYAELPEVARDYGYGESARPEWWDFSIKDDTPRLHHALSLR